MRSAAPGGRRGFARDIAGAGAQLNSTATWLAWLLALAVAAPPIMAIAAPWLVLRLRFFRRKWVALTLARTPAGEQLLALRALANRPLAKLAAINADPVGAWRREDAAAIQGLAALELRARGVARRRHLAISARYRRSAQVCTPKSQEGEPAAAVDESIIVCSMIFCADKTVC